MRRNDYSDYESIFDPMQSDRQARRKRKAKAHHVPKKHHNEIVEELADDVGIAGGFKTTYQPGLYEEEWLLSSLQAFYYQDLITDVVAIVKGGKEANVYRCKANKETTGLEWLAAKVYRPRKFRQIRNDQMYREGRDILGIDGKPLSEKDWRAQRAVNNGTNFGEKLSHTSWLMHEYKTLQMLDNMGASVPKPVASSENALLMSYHGDERLPAPTLIEVRLPENEAEGLFQEVMRNINLMLRHGFIHGDLSAYNILYWQGEVILIDFPQVVDIRSNPHARKILLRDIQRVCEYFEGYGIKTNAKDTADTFWKLYGAPDANLEEVEFNLQAQREAEEED